MNVSVEFVKSQLNVQWENIQNMQHYRNNNLAAPFDDNLWGDVNKKMKSTTLS